MPKNSKLLLFVLLIISSFLMTYQSKKGYIISKTFVNGLLDRSHSAAQSLSDRLKRPFEMMAASEKDNRQLKKRVDELMLERGQFQEAIMENRRLRELLKLREVSLNHVAASRVIARGIDHWAHTLTLDKGLQEGVTKDMSAITPLGLTGKIIDVSGAYSSLLLITDINFSVAVRLQESRKEGILSGTGSRTCILKYVPYETAVKPGDVIVTSGLDLLFPPGIPVGYISKVDSSGKGGKFQYIEVAPFQNDATIEEVIIVR